MIIVDHLTKRYGNVVAVDGLSFEVGPGDIGQILSGPALARLAKVERVAEEVAGTEPGRGDDGGGRRG